MAQNAKGPKNEDRITICRALRKDGKSCTRLAPKGEDYCWQHSPKFWKKFRRVTGIFGGIVAAIILYTTAIKNVADVKEILFPTATPTSSQTFTPTTTGTATSTPTPKAHGIYYMIVLDASINMLESFDGRTKWDAALEAVNAILESREEEANYGLVVIGGSGAQTGGDPCAQPADLALPYTTRAAVVYHLNHIQPAGGGCIYTAFNLAKDQFRPPLPENTIRTLIFITGSKDTCDTRDEWADLKRAFSFPGGIGVDQYSEIIVLEEDQFVSRTIEEQFASLSADLNLQSPNNFSMLIHANDSAVNVAIGNVSSYVETVSTSIPTNPPPPTLTVVAERTADMILATQPAPVVDTVFVPSVTPSFTIAPTLPPTLTPIPTNTLFPEIFYITYPQNNQVLDCAPGAECYAYVNVQWIPDVQAQSQRKYLSVWVRPLPELPDYCGQEYWPQNPPTYNGDGIWSVLSFIGNGDEAGGTSFAIYALVTNSQYGINDVSLTLPSYLYGESLLVYRGSGNPEPQTCP